MKGVNFVTGHLYLHVDCLLSISWPCFFVYENSGANSGPFLSDVKLFWPAVLMASSACHAGASIIKVKCTNLCTSNEPISYLNSYLFYSMAGICFY